MPQPNAGQRNQGVNGDVSRLITKSNAITPA
jgi:hypothetical protein